MNIPQGYKHTEFGLIPSDWVLCAFLLHLPDHDATDTHISGRTSLGRRRFGADHPHDTRPDILARVHQVIHDQREGRAERGDDRGVDGRGVRRPPEQHVHPAVDDQQRDNQNVARIAPRNAVGVAGEKGEGDEAEFNLQMQQNSD